MYKFKRKGVLFVIAVLLTSIIVSGCGDKGSDVAVAKVNGDTISLADYQEEYFAYRKLFERQFGEGQLDEVGPDGKSFDESLREEIIKRMIQETLIEQEAAKVDVAVEDSAVDADIATIKEQLGGDDGYTRFLYDSGITEDYFKKSTKMDLLITAYKEYYVENMEISEEDAKTYFEENKEDIVKIQASHILLENEEDAQAILDRLEAGEDFAELAIEESLDSGSGANGGDLGYFSRGTMIPEFEDAAFALEEGEVSEIVKSDVGYHIIKVEDKKDNFEDLKDEIMSTLKEEGYNNHILELEENADIEIFQEVIDEIEAPKSSSEDETDAEENSEENVEETEENKDAEVEETEETEDDEKKDNK